MQAIAIPPLGPTTNSGDTTVNTGGIGVGAGPGTGGGATVPSNPPFVPPTTTPTPPPITITTGSVTPPAPPTPPSTSVPSVVLAQPYLDPPGTTRIYKTEDAYQISPENLDLYVYTYAIGTDAAPTQTSFIVKNLCTQNTLGITLNIPQFLVTSVDSPFLLPPLETQTIDLTVSETGSINLIEQGKTTYSEPLIVSVEVLGVTGPVYVQTPGFISSTPSAPQTSSNGITINTPTGTIQIPAGLPAGKINLLLSQSLTR